MTKNSTDVFRKSNVVVGAVAVLLFVVHIFMSTYALSDRFYYKWSVKPFVVYDPYVYKLVSFGQYGLVSRVLLLYAFLNDSNFNISNTDMKGLVSALDSVVLMDDKNIQPYTHLIFYWSGTKNPNHLDIMRDFLLTGLELFPENWEIPYGLHRIAKSKEDEELQKEYIAMAADVALKYGGPKWLVDIPAIELQKLGEDEQSYYWLIESFKLTTDDGHRQNLLRTMLSLYVKTEDHSLKEKIENTLMDSEYVERMIVLLESYEDKDYINEDDRQILALAATLLQKHLGKEQP